ncbi:c-type cytochrome [Kordiimonas marina]|uniref:c-type cytochrome n=1 Tax=Kordiimonas marina TaxID=2872312 RepID=UPI001FF42585|nr:cytochrome c family protein [Kordiimonas marina]MCJ9430295.1 cytochrome c family protein [Kordiimonas marina]
MIKSILTLSLGAGLALANLTVTAHAEDSVSDTSFSSAGDAKVGERVFNRCKACHNLSGAQRHRIGPNLNGLFGRKVGTSEGYKYSKALQDADFVWTEAKLDKWLTKPQAFLPGNKMPFAGLKSAQERKNLIAYLRQATAE